MIKRKFENIILWFVGVTCASWVCEATLRFNAQGLLSGRPCWNGKYACGYIPQAWGAGD